MSRVQDYLWSNIEGDKINRTLFKRQSEVLTSIPPGKLIPIFWEIVYPGESIQMTVNHVVRMQTMLKPIFSRITLDIFWFSVPIRQVFSNFTKMMGEQVDPGDSIDYSVPIVNSPSGGWTESDLGAYFGLPLAGHCTLVSYSGTVDTSVLPFRSYNHVWNNWFRSQDLQDSAVMDPADGNQAYTDFPIRDRCRKRDYFSTCLPDPQRGDEIELPLGGMAPVIGDGTVLSFTKGSGPDMGLISDGSYTLQLGSTFAGQSLPYNSGTYGTQPAFDDGIGLSETNSGAYADLANADGPTVNEFRYNIALQHIAELDARSGTRYPEIVRAVFGVETDDARLMVPEYLGGGSNPFVVSQTEQTESGGSYGLGSLAGRGTSFNDGNGFYKSFNEHCILLGLASIQMTPIYQQGIERNHHKLERYDFMHPYLEDIGEQSVYNKEIFFTGTSADDDVFGWQERYADLKYKQSQIHGYMNSYSSNTLDPWHLGVKFNSLPVLDDVFIDEPLAEYTRVMYNTEEQFFIGQFVFNFNHVRQLKRFSRPGLRRI